MKKQFSIRYGMALLALFTGMHLHSQNVGINTTGAAPNASALLDVDAAPNNDKGILIPRVGLTQTTSNAPIGAGVATSLMVYNTTTVNDVTPGYYYWDGTKWVRLLGNNNAWLLLGNAGTTAGTNFLGTTDAQDMVFKTNNTEWMRILTNGNVGIGTSSPEVTLHVNTDNTTANPRCLLVQYNGNNNNSAFLVLRKTRGTSYATPAVVQNGDPLGTVLSEAYDGAANIRTGASMKFVANGTIAAGSIPTDIFFTTGSSGLGTEAMRITSGQNVGIGTSNPLSHLHVTRETRIEANPTATAVSLLVRGSDPVNQDNIALDFIKRTLDTASARIEFDGYSTQTLHQGLMHFSTKTNGGALTRRMTINFDGFVGIATVNPASILEVVENNTTGIRGIVGTQYGNHPLGSRLILRKAKGTNLAPTPPLSFENIGLVVYTAFDGATWTDGATVESKTTQNWAPGANGCNLIFTTTANNTTGRQDRMTITDVGNVGINTNAPTAKLQVNGEVLFTNGQGSTFWSNVAQRDFDIIQSGTSTNRAFTVHSGANSGSAFNNIAVDFYGNDGAGNNLPGFTMLKNCFVGIGTIAPTAALHVVGNICYTGGIGACSDARYKKNFNPIENALQNVLKMNGLTYNWRVEEFPDQKFTTEKQIGFIAQDLEKIYPELVITDKNGYKSVDYAKLTPILVEAMKEQQKKIEGLELQVKNSSNQNENLKTELTNLKSQYGNRLAALEEILNARAQK